MCLSRKTAPEKCPSLSLESIWSRQEAPEEGRDLKIQVIITLCACSGHALGSVRALCALFARSVHTMCLLVMLSECSLINLLVLS